MDPVAVANRLRPVLLQLNRRLRRELEPLGITGGQAALMHAVRSHPGIGVQELARHEGVSSAGMSIALTRLERAGLVRRTREGADRRRVGLELTEDGVRVVRSARSRRTAWLAARLRRLPDADLAAVDRAVEPLLRLLEEPA
ncbi:MAG TPA: MarR family transcriptional regulator [Gaiellales bacterium]|nr:MarR family transcriptional regulator [Gaiellales bacterium]